MNAPADDGDASRESTNASELDAVRLDAFLRERCADLRGAPVIERTQGGLSNPTYFVSYGDRRMVLRKQPSAMLSGSAHLIDREFRVMSALYGSEVPVPRPILYHAERDVVGTPFYLMERIEGRVLHDYAMPGLSPAARGRSYDAMCRAMAAIHRFDWRAAGLSGYGREGNYFARQLNRWSEQWRTFRQPGDSDIDTLAAWLASRIPESETLTLCHGDLRLGNMMLHPTEAEVVGVLDWELSTLGHPLFDLAYNTMAWRMAPDENGGLRGRPLAAMGIPSEAEYLERYYQYSGGEERLQTFHKVFALFRAAAGSASVAARGRKGEAFVSDAAAIGGRLAMAYAKRGVELIAES